MDHSPAGQLDLRSGPIRGEAEGHLAGPVEEVKDMSIGSTLALLAAIGYGTADFVGGTGARRAPTMSIVFIGQVTGAAAMLVVALASPGSPTPAHLAWALLAGLG